MVEEEKVEEQESDEEEFMATYSDIDYHLKNARYKNQGFSITPTSKARSFK